MTDKFVTYHHHQLECPMEGGPKVVWANEYEAMLRKIDSILSSKVTIPPEHRGKLKRVDTGEWEIPKVNKSWFCSYIFNNDGLIRLRGFKSSGVFTQYIPKAGDVFYVNQSTTSAGVTPPYTGWHEVVEVDWSGSSYFYITFDIPYVTTSFNGTIESMDEYYAVDQTNNVFDNVFCKIIDIRGTVHTGERTFTIINDALFIGNIINLSDFIGYFSNLDKSVHVSPKAMLGADSTWGGGGFTSGVTSRISARFWGAFRDIFGMIVYVKDQQIIDKWVDANFL
jgi:hypothetical protein